MSIRSNGSYIGPRPTGPSSTVASGIWDLRTAQRNRAAGNWPTFAVTDPDFANVSLLLHFDNNLTDSSANGFTTTATTGVAVTGTESKFGGYSLGFSAPNGGASVPHNAAFDFGSGNFVIEGWYYFSNVSEYQMLFQKHNNSNASNSAVALRFDGALSLKKLTTVICVGSTQADFGSNWTPSTGQWYHIALSRSGNDFNVYADGTRIGTQSISGTINSASGQPFRIGGTAFANDTYLRGYVDDFRVTKGTDRGYTGATISVPTAAFPDA